MQDNAFSESSKRFKISQKESREIKLSNEHERRCSACAIMQKAVSHDAAS